MRPEKKVKQKKQGKKLAYILINLDARYRLLEFKYDKINYKNQGVLITKISF